MLALKCWSQSILQLLLTGDIFRGWTLSGCSLLQFKSKKKKYIKKEYKLIFSGVDTQYPFIVSIGADKYHESSYLPNEDSKTHNCGIISEDESRHKYQVHNNGDPRFRGVYSFPVDPIPRRNCSDEEAMQFLQEGVKIDNFIASHLFIFSAHFETEIK